MRIRLREKVTTAPTIEPVTAAEAKLHASVDGGDWDDFFDEKIESARRMVEALANRSLITRTYTGKMDGFPCESAIYLPFPPAIAVTSIAYLDSSGNSQTLATTVYGVDEYMEPGRIYLKHNQVWPTTYDQPNSVTIVWTAGYGAAATSVPANYKTAISQLVAHWYKFRELDGQMPEEVAALCNLDRVVAFA